MGDMLTMFSFDLCHKNIFKKIPNYLRICDPRMSFSYEKENNQKIFMSYVEMTRENGQLVTSVYRKALIVVCGLFYISVKMFINSFKKDQIS